MIFSVTLHYLFISDYSLTSLFMLEGNLKLFKILSAKQKHKVIEKYATSV